MPGYRNGTFIVCFSLNCKHPQGELLFNLHASGRVGYSQVTPHTLCSALYNHGEPSPTAQLQKEKSDHPFYIFHVQQPWCRFQPPAQGRFGEQKMMNISINCSTALCTYFTFILHWDPETSERPLSSSGTNLKYFRETLLEIGFPFA